MSDLRFRELQRAYSESNNSETGLLLVQEAVRVGRLDPSIRDALHNINNIEDTGPDHPGRARGCWRALRLRYTGLCLREAFKAIFEHPNFMFDECTKTWDQEVVAHLKEDIEHLIGYILTRSEQIAMLHSSSSSWVRPQPWDADVWDFLGRLSNSFEYVHQQNQIPQVAPYASGDFELTQDPDWRPDACWKAMHQFYSAISPFMRRGYPVSGQNLADHPSEYAALLSAHFMEAHFCNDGDGFQYPPGFIFIVESYNVFQCIYENPPWPEKYESERYRAAVEAGTETLNTLVLPELVSFAVTLI